jgi:hypothetical protein
VKDLLSTEKTDDIQPAFVTGGKLNGVAEFLPSIGEE